MRRPRVLMLSIVNPEVERNGAATVTRGLIAALTSEPLGAQVDCVPVRAAQPRMHRWAQARSLLTATISCLPSKVAYLQSREFRERVESRLARNEYELVILNGSDILWILEYLPAAVPRILVAHNIEHVLFESQIRSLGLTYRPLHGLLHRDCRRLRDFELNGLKDCGNVLFLSSVEARYAAELCDGLRSIVIPPVFTYPPYPGPKKQPGPVLEIGYLGNFGWWPNRLGLDWFSERVLPAIQGPVRLHLFGEGNTRGGASDRVVRHGAVERLDRVWETCDFLICPAFSGGGVCVKLSEAVYNGMPVLANRHAARGLPIESDPAIVLLDEPAEWIGFLNSADGRNLGSRRVSPTNAARFSAGYYKDSLHGYLETAITLPALPHTLANTAQ